MILPPLVRHIAEKQLSQQFNRPATIQQIRINPFAFSTTVRGLLINDPDGQPFLSWDEVYVRFRITSLFGKAWRFQEISISRPFVRVQMNADRTFNFSDLVTKFSTNSVPAASMPAKPILLRVDRLHIAGASAAYTDFTPREAFRRTLGPVDITLENFQTDPANKNRYAFTGTTDAGEEIAWNGFFYLSPLRSQGELKLANFTLNKYAALYQDLVRFEIRSGTLGLDVNYRFELSPSNRVAAVDNASFALRDFKLGVPGSSNNLAEAALFSVEDATGDLPGRTVTVGSVDIAGGKLNVRRGRDDTINVVEAARPSDNATNVPGGILFLLRSVTNAVSLLLQSTNQWSGMVRSVTVTNCAVHLEDDVNTRPARLDLSDIALVAKNISNLPGTNLTAELSVRWNTNGSIKTSVSAAFLPPTADVRVDLDRIDLGTLDPYLEPKLNLFILGSKVGLHGDIHLGTPVGALPQVTFHGDANLDDFRTVDGVWAEDLVKWDSLRFSGIDANLNPESVSIREILMEGAYARIIVETNQTINVLNALRMATPGMGGTNAATNALAGVRASAPAAAPGPKAALPQMAIGAIVISNTAVSFTDRTIQPNVSLAVEQVNGRIAGLSTEQLQHADVAVTAMIEGVGPASITGIINPFSGTQTNRLKISVQDVDMTPAGPYAGRFAGYGIAEGKLNLDLTYELIGRNLKSANVITLDRFTFGERVDSPEATHLPVRLAVAILKDRQGKIVLDVPVEGSLDDPKFRIRKVVIRVIVNILTKVATSPFSLLGAVFGGGGPELSYQDFAAGSADLTAADTKKLDAMRNGLYERPALGLEIAGSVDADNDRTGLQRAALDQEIRAREWTALRQAGQATNSAQQIALTPEVRARWLAKLYEEKVGTNGSAAVAVPTTNVAPVSVVRLVPPVTGRVREVPALDAVKGATLLMWRPTATVRPAAVTNSTSGVEMAAAAASAGTPTVDMEASLLAIYTITDADLETLAASRARAVQSYLLQGGKVTAGRLFLKVDSSATLRRQGSRVYLQFR